MCHFKYEETGAQRGSHYQASKKQDWGSFGQGLSLLPSTLTPIATGHTDVRLLWTRDCLVTMEAHVVFHMWVLAIAEKQAAVRGFSC